MTQKNIYLASKPRYEILDGLRGVAAMLAMAGLSSTPAIARAIRSLRF